MKSKQMTPNHMLGLKPHRNILIVPEPRRAPGKTTVNVYGVRAGRGWRGVNLKDINDNAPAFLQGVYNARVTESSTAGEYVMTISEVDYDGPEEGGNEDIVYSIEKNVVEEETAYLRHRLQQRSHQDGSLLPRPREDSRLRNSGRGGGRWRAKRYLKD
ncbi:beta-catenin binding [Homalodisca vitripennis]|nr:beta-catenin binding [Homalodisca vitripennis]